VKLWEITLNEPVKVYLKSMLVQTSDGSRSKNFDPGQVESNFCCSGRVRLGQPSLVWEWIWKISPKNVKFFKFLPFGSKKLSSGRVEEYLGQSWVGLLFTAGQKYVWVGSGQGPSLV